MPPPASNATVPTRVVVMGVAGAGKSTVGQELAGRLDRRFVDGDALHPERNVRKMAAGEPLADDDRWPWLATIRDTMRRAEPVVVACSALRRSYRDLLRRAGPVTFVLLDIDPGVATGRVSGRTGHFMGVDMIASQFDALEMPSAAESDVVVVDGRLPLPRVVDDIIDALPASSVSSVPPLGSVGGTEHSLDEHDVSAFLDAIVHTEIGSRRRILIVPPDQTRAHSRAGEITVELRSQLLRRGCDVAILPALGTHLPMDDLACRTLFHGHLSPRDLLTHDWRTGLRHLGRIGEDEVRLATGGRYGEPLDVAVDAQLFDRWDLVISVGQVVPHEVIGMANFTKNIVIGLGGAPTIHRSHFIGAVAGMETIMGRIDTPVRDLVDAAFDRFVAPIVPVLWIMTVVEDTGDDVALRGIVAGTGGSADSGGSAFREAARLAGHVNVTRLASRPQRCVCWLDPSEFHSTWLGNKAVYRTRMAMAEGGELTVLAPSVRRFGEDEEIDLLIRRHGYHGTPTTLDAVERDPDLASNLSAAAHLIHGSSEGRFDIVYCTDPDAGGLTQSEVESVGYSWRPLRDELRRLGCGAATPTGSRVDVDDDEYMFVANPALGLWTSSGLDAHDSERQG